MEFKVLEKEFIFEDDRPFLSCHAATLLVLPNDEILAAWFGGTRERHPDVGIWCSRRINGKWTYPVQVAKDAEIAHWNPVLFQAKDGLIYLFYKVGPKISEWYTMVKTSSDNGLTWSESKPLVEGDIGGRGPVKNKPIRLSDGTILAPASIEMGKWSAFVDISYDEGKTWTKSEQIPYDYEKGKGIIQPALWESEPGKVHMLLRSTDGIMYRSDSNDGGKTWCQAYHSGLPNNNSGFDLVKMDNGVLVLCYNPLPGIKAPRSPLAISVSTNNGLTWTYSLILDEGNDGWNEPGSVQYSYPSIVSKDNCVYIVYTWRRKRIAYTKIMIEKTDDLRINLDEQVG